MQKLLPYLIIAVFFLSCDNEEVIKSNPENLEYSQSEFTLKVGRAFVSDTPTIEGVNPMEFTIEDVKREGVSIDFSASIFIETINGSLTIVEGNDLTSGFYSIDIKVTNAEGESIFEQALIFEILALDIPTDLLYSTSENTQLTYDQVYTTDEPVLNGISPFEFSFPAGYVNNAVSINSETGIIQIEALLLSKGTYSIPVKVSNEDGETIFENAFQFEVFGQYEGYQNGFYFRNSSKGTLSNLLSANIIEGESFSSAEREGLHYTYSYLEAANYDLVSVEAGEVINRLGGGASLRTPDNNSSSCGLGNYWLDENPGPNGENYVIESDALYIIIYDEQKSEVIYQIIENISVIGSSTSEGWGNDISFDMISLNVESGEYKINEIPLTVGQYRYRFNCQWSIDRRIDRNLPVGDPSNGYVLPTSLSYDMAKQEILIGNQGNDFMLELDGFYEMNLNWDGGINFSQNLLRLRDLPVMAFNPNDFDWAIVGEATELGWPTNNDCNTEGQDIGLTYVGESTGSYYWQIASIDLSVGAFKFRANNCWEVNLGSTNASITGTASDNFNFQGDNFNCLVSGTYNINLYTEDEGESYVMEVSQ